MFVEILTLGDELCCGEIADSNSAWLARELWTLGVTVQWMTSCRDDRDDMKKAFTQAASRSSLVLVSGGLGPTEDDLTVDVVAELTGVMAVTDEPAKQRMEARAATAKYSLSPNHFRQVRVPARSRVFANPAGLAPGFEVSLNGTSVICMPGVPREMKAMFDSEVRDRVRELQNALGEEREHIARRTYRVFGLGESQIATLLGELVAGVAGATLHYQAVFPEVLVKVVVRDRDPDAARARLEAVDGEVRGRLAHHLYGTGDDSLAVVLGRELGVRGATMATAESCTGGLVAALITDVPGSSAYFAGGAVTYSNAEKTRQLGVPEVVFATHGAVSEACVEAMARGARERFGVDYAVAVSGVAGPSGGTPEKPVGTVWLAVAGPHGGRTKLLSWPGERSQIRRLAAYWALALTLQNVIHPPTREADHDP